jgi:hypothetical protein
MELTDELPAKYFFTIYLNPVKKHQNLLAVELDVIVKCLFYCCIVNRLVPDIIVLKYQYAGYSLFLLVL